MRFTFVDKVIELVPGERITTIKTLTLAEEYLADHFPRFPVMPGVLMIESLTQASAWLVRASEDFAHSLVLLKEARNVKFANFVVPGQVLTVTSEIIKEDEREIQFKSQGVIGNATAVSARLVLERFNLADECPDRVSSDIRLRRWLRELWSLIYQPATSLAAGNGQQLV